MVILWNLSASTPLVIGSQSFNIPGYLVWAALIYAVLGTWVTHLVGKPLIKLNFDQQRYEADFRFSLVRLRENAEEVTLLAGERAEKERLLDRFGRVVGNWYGIMQRTKRLTFLTAGYSQVAVIFPFIVVSPLYFAGSMMLGGLDADRLGLRPGAGRAVVLRQGILRDRRLEGGAEPACRASTPRWTGPRGSTPTAPRVQLVSDGGTAMAAEELTVSLPNRRGDRARLQVSPSGLPSACWSPGRRDRARRACSGRLAGCGRSAPAPSASRKARSSWCLPQRPYLPLGTLRGALAYPGPDDAFTPDEIDDVLDATGLSHLREALDETAYWADRLSMGEQQRLSIARALLQKPDWLFLDEATAALDEPAEAHALSPDARAPA